MLKYGVDYVNKISVGKSSGIGDPPQVARENAQKALTAARYLSHVAACLRRASVEKNNLSHRYGGGDTIRVTLTPLTTFHLFFSFVNNTLVRVQQ